MKQLVQLLRPTGLEVVWYIFGVAAILFAASFSTVLDTIVGASESQREEVSAVGGVFDSRVDSFTGSLDGTTAAATITTLLFWAAAGALLYIIFWALINGFIDFYNDAATAKTYVKGQQLAAKNPMKEYVGRLVFRTTSVIVGVAYLLLFLRLLMPLWSDYFRYGASHIDEPGGFLGIIIGIIGGTISVHVFTIIARLVTMRLRVYGEII